MDHVRGRLEHHLVVVRRHQDNARFRPQLDLAAVLHHGGDERDDALVTSGADLLVVRDQGVAPRCPNDVDLGAVDAGNLASVTVADDRRVRIEDDNDTRTDCRAVSQPGLGPILDVVPAEAELRLVVVEEFGPPGRVLLVDQSGHVVPADDGAFGCPKLLHCAGRLRLCRGGARRW